MASSRIFGATGAVAALSTVALLALTGCEGSFAQRRLDYSDTEEVKITSIAVRPGSGTVSVRTAAVSNVQIKRVLRYRGPEPTTTNYRLDGKQLIIDADCGRQCGVSYDILAPQGISVQGENGSGDVSLTGVGDVDVKVGSGEIRVSDVAGTVKVETGSGRVRLTDVKGPVTARTGSGGIEGHGLGGGPIDFQAGSGGVTLDLDTVSPVRARSGSGGVELSVPNGSYQVRASTESGDKTIDVANDPNSTTLLDLSTGSGDIEVHQA